MSAPMNRRAFLVRSTAAGGMLVGFTIPGVRTVAAAAASVPNATVVTPMSAWITISSTGAVTIQVGSTEMGQGVLTSLPQIVAEELMIDWVNITTVHSPAGAQWGNPAYGGAQVTGGSFSIRGYYDAMRLAGATVREMLIQAAANYWHVAPSSCTAAHGKVTHVPTGRVRAYGVLAASAALLTPPTNPPLTDPAQFRLIGTSVTRPDIPKKVNGKAVFGTDVKLTGLLHAAVRHSPTLGGTTATVGTTPAGTLGVVDLGNGVAVVANRWWTAYNAVNRLPVTWNAPASTTGADSTALAVLARQLMTTPTSPPAVADQSGDAPGAITGSTTKFSATYSVPFLAHAVLEPVNLTTLVTPTSCTMWGSVQNQAATVATAAALTGLDPSQITLNTTLLGGGLGRKLESDYVSESVRIAMQFPGQPVKLLWPRREDFAYDKFRPMALMKVDAGLDGTGNVAGWRNRIVTPSILAQKGFPFGSVDGQAVEGAVGLPYSFGARLVEWIDLPTTVPLGFMRSVGHSFNAFAVESAMDELAYLAGADPLAFRMQALAGSPRHQAVLGAVGTLAGWGTVTPGRALGVAIHESFGSIVAQVAEVSQPTAGQIKIHRISCVVDCGTAIHPDLVTAQMEGGIVHGLNAALFGRISLSKGVPSPTNYDKYRTLRMRDMPRVDVQIINSGAPLGGVGEPGVPPTAPAVANAWFALTGQRKRSLPMF